MSTHAVEHRIAARRGSVSQPRHAVRDWLLRGLVAVVGIALFAYVGVSAYVATHLTAERHLPAGTPAEVSLVYQDVTFESVDDHILLRGWYLPAGGTRAVVLLHGLDGSRWSQDDGWSDVIVPALVHGGFDVLTFDLRAHGESGGDHVGLGSLERRDVQAAVALVRQHGIPPGEIGLFGQSFGAATALNAAAVIPEVGTVVSDSAFADARPLLDQEVHRYTGMPPIFTPAIAGIASVLYGIDLDATPEEAMPRIAPRPVLLIHGAEDARIPVQNAYRLKAATTSPAVQLWIVPGAGHTEAFRVDPERYVARLVGFLDDALAGRATASGDATLTHARASSERAYAGVSARGG